MPKRSRSGVVSSPARVVAPTSVNGGRSSVTTRAPGALADGDRQLAVLHRRIEGLLQRARQAVQLVDEEDAARLERGQERGDVALALERRAGGLHERDVELGGEDLGQRGLAEAGRAGEQDVVERLAARGRGLERDRQLLAQRGLADELLEAPRAQRAVELLVGEQGGRCLDAVAVAVTGAAPLQRAARAAPRRSRPRRRASSAVGLAGLVAELEQPGAGELVRLVGAATTIGAAVVRQRRRRPSRAARRRSARRSACRRPARPGACARRRRRSRG